MNQNDYFSTIHESKFDEYTYSGWELLNKINRNEHVLDVGCGRNFFNPYLPHLIGVDPANKNADHMICIEDFETDIKFDVALCLGSINFGSYQTIYNQINKIVSLLKSKSRIYWRCNPGDHDHNNDECKELDFFPWSYEYHNHFATNFKYNVHKICLEPYNGRIYAEWIKKQ